MRAGCLDPVQHRHPDIHQHHVRYGRADQPYRFFALACLAHDLDARLAGQQRDEPGADEILVVDHRDPQRSGRSASHAGTAWLAAAGSTACTRNPPPVRGAASMLPPKTATRSRMPVSPNPPTPSAAAVRMMTVPSPPTA
jgi:hypothetical protein